MSSNKMEPELPNGWCWATVGDTGRYINGFAFKPEHREPTGRPIVRIQNLTDPEKPLNRTSLAVPDDFCVETGGMLVSWSATVDVFVWNREPAFVNQHIFKVVPDENLVDRTFLFYWLKVAIDQLLDSEHLHGSTMKHINRGPFMAHRIPLPPLPEQQRLADKLEELLSDLDAGVAELKAAQRKLAQYRQSLLKAAVDGTLTADWRAAHGAPQETGAGLLQRILAERRARWEQKQLAKFAEQGKAPPKGWQAKYPEPVAPDLTDLPLVPEGWVWASLGQTAAETLIGLDRGQEHQSATGGVGYVKMNNISMDGGVDAENIVRIEANDEEMRRYQVAKRDLLFNTRNSKELVGKVGLVRSLSGPTVYNNNLMRIRFDGAVTPEFACYQLCGPEFRGRMERVKKATTSVAAVYAKDLFPLAIAIPPLAEQAEIARRLDAVLLGVGRQEVAVQLSLKQSSAQRKNLLKAAFCGQLVSQDPNDEPASQLLARIRAAREQSPAPRGRRRAGSHPAPATNPPTPTRRGRKAKEGA